MGQTFRLFISGDEAHDIISQIGDLVNKVGPKEPGHEIRAKELHFFSEDEPSIFWVPTPQMMDSSDSSGIYLSLVSHLEPID